MHLPGSRSLILYILFTTVISSSVRSQHTDTLLLKQLLTSNAPLFDSVLNHPLHKEVQILYTQITRDKNNRPRFRSFSYRLDAKRYFYPASTVKLPTAIFALEKLNRLAIPGLNISTKMLTDSSFAGQSTVTADTSAGGGRPTIGHYIKKILLVSDNDAYNRLYEFTGRHTINARLKALGLNNTRITGRLAIGDKGASKKHSNPIRFLEKERLIYRQPPQYDSSEYPMQLENTQQGWAYMNGSDSLVKKPFDFSEMNVYPLYDQQMVLRRLLFPETFSPGQRFKLRKADYDFLYRYMSMFPNESKDPVYPRPGYFPAYCKFLYYGADSASLIDPGIRIFNKVGDSYGYAIDNAYIVDFKNNIEFMLSAVIQSNEDGIYNDDKYEYRTICFPFLKNLGRVIYEYEKKRPKKYPPDLSRFRFTFP